MVYWSQVVCNTTLHCSLVIRHLQCWTWLSGSLSVLTSALQEHFSSAIYNGILTKASCFMIDHNIGCFMITILSTRARKGWDCIPWRTSCTSTFTGEGKLFDLKRRIPARKRGAHEHSLLICPTHHWRLVCFQSLSDCFQMLLEMWNEIFWQDIDVDNYDVSHYWRVQACHYSLHCTYNKEASTTYTETSGYIDTMYLRINVWCFWVLHDLLVERHTCTVGSSKVLHNSQYPRACPLNFV